VIPANPYLYFFSFYAIVNPSHDQSMLPLFLSSLQNSTVKHLVQLRKEQSYREKCSRVLVLGKKTIQSLPSTIPIHTLFLEESLPFIQLNLQGEIIRTTKQVMQKITGLLTSDGYAAEVFLPPYQEIGQEERILILDQLQDPGNMGTLIRTAAAFSFDLVYCIEGSVDPFNDKALRAAKGATFTIPLGYGNWEKLQKNLEKGGYHIYAADVTGDPLRSVPFLSPLAIILGNEGGGISLDGGKLNAQSITIECDRQKVESLNVAVAGTICLYEINQQRKANG